MENNEHLQRKHVFKQLFCRLAEKYGTHKVWADFIQMSAIAISNTCDFFNYAEREKQFLSIATQYEPQEYVLFSQLLGIIFEYSKMPFTCDFLGELYMELNLENRNADQFFTPFSVCQLMSSLSMDRAGSILESQKWITVNDPTCGSGANLLAAAYDLKRKGIDYQTSAFFTGQDLDYVVACMCYIQLSLAGCAGYVKVGNSLTHPLCTIGGCDIYAPHDPSVWVTPMYYHTTWNQYRESYLSKAHTFNT